MRDSFAAEQWNEFAYTCKKCDHFLTPVFLKIIMSYPPYFCPCDTWCQTGIDIICGNTIPVLIYLGAHGKQNMWQHHLLHLKHHNAIKKNALPSATIWWKDHLKMWSQIMFSYILVLELLRCSIWGVSTILSHTQYFICGVLFGFFVLRKWGGGRDEHPEKKKNKKKYYQTYGIYEWKENHTSQW